VSHNALCVVYSRSAGKTIVYEILALRRLISTNKPFMLVLPTVVLCQQKVSPLPQYILKAHKLTAGGFISALCFLWTGQVLLKFCWAIV